ncbi:hypothetical protein MOMUL_19310 [Moorella mulderi DSM 14980]|uniref:Uncharacterized protein n=1 Tax=Moorella mulderi DSM 14980 TaxID=1122241 RepID=A0A151AVX8_9FIRM|nr:hypothetical protein MOMUL_19310 [Moorella mulderi DSM 14980]
MHKRMGIILCFAIVLSLLGYKYVQNRGPYWQYVQGKVPALIFLYVDENSDKPGK